MFQLLIRVSKTIREHEVLKQLTFASSKKQKFACSWSQFSVRVRDVSSL